MKSKDQTTRTENLASDPADAAAPTDGTKKKHPQRRGGDDDGAPVPAITPHSPAAPPGANDIVLPFTTEEADDAPDTGDTSASASRRHSMIVEGGR